MIFILRQLIFAGLILTIFSARADLPTTFAQGDLINRSEISAILQRGHKIADIVEIQDEQLVEMSRSVPKTGRLQQLAMDLSMGQAAMVVVCAAAACLVVAMPMYCGGIGRSSAVCAPK